MVSLHLLHTFMKSCFCDFDVTVFFSSLVRCRTITIIAKKDSRVSPTSSRGAHCSLDTTLDQGSALRFRRYSCSPTGVQCSSEFRYILLSSRHNVRLWCAVQRTQSCQRKIRWRVTHIKAIAAQSLFPGRNPFCPRRKVVHYCDSAVAVAHRLVCNAVFLSPQRVHAHRSNADSRCNYSLTSLFSLLFLVVCCPQRRSSRTFFVFAQKPITLSHVTRMCIIFPCGSSNQACGWMCRFPFQIS